MSRHRPLGIAVLRFMVVRLAGRLHQAPPAPRAWAARGARVVTFGLMVD